MSVHRSSRKCKASYVFLLVICGLALLIFIFCKQLSEHIDEISEYEGRVAAVELINRAVSKQLDANNGTQLIDIQKDSNGNIISVNADSEKVNQLNNAISVAVTEGLQEIENEDINVPVGTLSGITFMTGRGFNIPLKLHQIGAVSTEMKSELLSGGINQTKYRLYLEISVEMSAVLPAHSTDISVDYEYLVGETVVVGKVPQMYLSK